MLKLSTKTQYVSSLKQLSICSESMMEVGTQHFSTNWVIGPNHVSALV